jgi:hypothetical protein
MPFSTISQSIKTLGSAPSGRDGRGGFVNLALKRQAIQIPPFQGEDETLDPCSSAKRPNDLQATRDIEDAAEPSTAAVGGASTPRRGTATRAVPTRRPS